MDIMTAVQNTRINAFEIISFGNTFSVLTYAREGEKSEDFTIRHQKNILKANQLKKTKPAV